MQSKCATKNASLAGEIILATFYGAFVLPVRPLSPYLCFKSAPFLIKIDNFRSKSTSFARIATMCIGYIKPAVSIGVFTSKNHQDFMISRLFKLSTLPLNSEVMSHFLVF